MCSRGAGYRVAVVDLRGHGDSDVTFRTHGDVATAGDLLALIALLGGPAVILGNSMGAAAGAWAAAERANAVAGLVLYGPLLREPAQASALAASTRRWMSRLLYRLAFVRPWGAAFWAGYYRTLNTGTRAPWLAEHVTAIRDSLSEPGRLRSFRHLALQLDHSVVESRLGQVRAPIRAFLGESDPDWADPAAEAAWINTLGGPGGGAELVPDAGHYPHAQRPGLVVPATLDFLRTLPRSADVWLTRA